MGGWGQGRPQNGGGSRSEQPSSRSLQTPYRCSYWRCGEWVRGWGGGDRMRVGVEVGVG